MVTNRSPEEHCGEEERPIIWESKPSSVWTLQGSREEKSPWNYNSYSEPHLLKVPESQFNKLAVGKDQSQIREWKFFIGGKRLIHSQKILQVTKAHQKNLQKEVLKTINLFIEEIIDFKKRICEEVTV